MNSVSPAAAQYGSPESRRRRNLGSGHDPPQMGFQDTGRDGATDEVDKIKSKLLTAWNSLKYGWTVKMKTHFSRSSPLYLLGRHYHFRYEDDIERFQQDFVSRVWMTYRRDFPALEGTQLTTDCGWGCMIRSAQMLLAQALLMHLLCRDWSWPEALNTLFVEMEPDQSSSLPPHNSFSSVSSAPHSSYLHSRAASCPRPYIQNPHQEHIHRDILRWLSDHPDAPFGLHHMVKLGGSLGKKAGDWYGPSIVAHILRKALERSPQVPELSVYVSQDCTVYRADVEQLLDTGDPVTGTRSTGRAVIILIPVRLGGENFNPVYKQCIKEFLQMPSCLGIIGGKPKHSLYFIGYQDNHLLYLDPHYCQAYVDTSVEDFPLDTFHCNSPRKMSIVKMDPSCTMAFYARNRADFGALCDHLTKVLSSSSAEEKYPVFSFSEGQAQEFHVPEVLPLASYTLAHRKRVTMAKRPSSDEFEFL
ncbi:cysteine protease ATG4D [Bufo bufo]|uniref:cysteine protease ATG4D n=1 Tax=Bufo bufo TaxID=8384 RepID=UPI001ABDACFF|nr:cysteine protease ATG4D [Bufo bufo]XP_040270876.1 cysteine protease ATG4D [Bufo bufo]XP_040270877.1 cysteine protease ATG4D [Bufo bufo]XP_040270878.1 cysteine protease ATG4D [Bufo bufo]XP_040270879.1 cysteine protease ATG4D [Bufo bufo]